MIDELKPYAEYKQSSLCWLEQIPAHWEVCRNGRLFAQRKETGFGHLPILEVSLRTGVRVRNMENLTRKQVMSDRNKYKRAVSGDIAYNMMRMWQGAVGVTPQDGLISPAYVVARPRTGVNSRYFAYLFKTDAYKGEVDGHSHGIVKDRNRLYWEDFKQIGSCTPPTEEQGAIVRFLAEAGRRTNRLIQHKRQLVALLNEQKQAVVTQAVTRGLNLSVPMITSGMDWLGEIPNHWTIRRLRTVADLRTSNVNKLSYSYETQVRLCNYTDVYKNDRITSSLEFMQATASSKEIESFRLLPGDVVITKDSEDWQDIGVPSIVVDDINDLVCGYHLAILRPRPNCLHGRYLAYALQARSATAQFSVSARGVTRYALSQGDIKALLLPVPPLDEQRDIYISIDHSTHELRKAVQRATREIDLIREHRTRLTADVVTGKLDVRSAAAELDDIADAEPEPLADTDTEFEDTLEEVADAQS